MSDTSLIKKYFPKLDENSLEKLEKLKEVYANWNAQINVVSRKDFDNFVVQHVIHSLAISKIHSFKDGLDILDVGTGGGFPGLPLAIMFPECNFTLVDSIGKKIKVVKEVCEELQIKNIEAINDRAENINKKFDFVVSRAVTAMPIFLPWVRKKFKSKSVDSLPNGILYLKGGDLIEEMSPVEQYYKIHDLKKFFDEEWFDTKKVVYVKM